MTIPDSVRVSINVSTIDGLIGYSSREILLTTYDLGNASLALKDEIKENVKICIEEILSRNPELKVTVFSQVGGAA